MTKSIDSILNKIVCACSNVAGIDAVVLGGSRATHTANETSDIDIGIYYNPNKFCLIKLQQNLAKIDDTHGQNAITEIGEWGQWINGGGWLSIENTPVDILFRDTTKVISVIDNCLAGTITIDYQCGHPFGFVNSIYMGELVYCHILSSSNNVISDQKERIKFFPEIYKLAVIRKFLWECEFSLMCGKKSISKKDVVYAAGSIFRCAVSLIQVVYALNDMYMINEKGSLQRLITQNKGIIPVNFSTDINSSMAMLSDVSLEDSFKRIEHQLEQVKHICNELSFI